MAPFAPARVVFGSVRNWLTILIVIVVAFAMLAVWAYVVPPLRGRLVAQKLADARTNAQLVSSTFGTFLGASLVGDTAQVTVTNPSGLERALNIVSASVGGRAIVYTANQVLVKDSSGQVSPDVADYPMLAEAIRTKRVTQGTVSTSTGRVAATAVPLAPDNSPGTIIAAVLVLSSLKDVDYAVNAVQRQLLFATLLALAISLALGYFASFFIALRLKRIERSAELVAGGDLSTKVPETVGDEIGQLAGTFNVMAERLRDAFAQVEYERDRVEVLLNDLSEGVIGVSAAGTVTIANPAAAILLGTPTPVGATVDQALPPDVAQLWRDSQHDAELDMIVFAHKDVTLEATTYPVAGDADFTSIVVLRDVTSQARLERARRDLIANASHEFKTPLFSLAGSLELIDEGNLSPEEQREFLQIMRQQVDRLRTMAVSMLDLSRVEAGSFKLAPEDIDLSLIGRSVLDEFQAQAQAKRLELLFVGEGGLTAWCDEQRLVQVLRALIDNAIKYSPTGSSVRLSAEIEGDEAVVTVADDGPGISPEDLPHVFERFHRGRAERATTTGAGLGLSIARELAEMMGGEITVSPPAAGGARFTVHLPRAADARRRRVPL